MVVSSKNIVGALAVGICALAGCTVSISNGSNAEPAEVGPPATTAGAAEGEEGGEGEIVETAGETPGETPGPQTGDPAEARDPDKDAAALAEDSSLTTRVVEAFGEYCKPERACGDILGVDCMSATDGPYHFVKADSLEKITTCGGACRARDCSEDCPPAGWDCKTY